MDQARFDSLARSVASSRREVLRGVLAGSLGLLAGSRAARAAPTTVGVCHRTGSPAQPLVYIEVVERAVPVHAAHGDDVYVNLVTDPDNCGACGVRCDDGNSCTVDTCENEVCVHRQVVCPTPGDACSASFGACYCEVDVSLRGSNFCGSGSFCNCFTTTEDEVICGQGDEPCAGAASCASSAECPTGRYCVLPPPEGGCLTPTCVELCRLS